MPVDVGLHSARAIVFTDFDFQRITQIHRSIGFGFYPHQTTIVSMVFGFYSH